MSRRQKKLKQHKYEIVVAVLLDEFRAGVYPPGATLPKERDLSVRYQVALGTARRAMQELEQRGYVRRVRGHGTFACDPGASSRQQQQTAFAMVVPQVREGLYPCLIDGFDEANHETHDRHDTEEKTATRPPTIICNSRNDFESQQKLLRRMVDRGVSGIAMVPVTHGITSDDDLNLVLRKRIPLVFCHRSVPGVAAPLITWNAREVGRLAARIFLEAGHDQVTALLAEPDQLTDQTLLGMCDELARRGLDRNCVESVVYRRRLPGRSAEDAIRHCLEARLQSSDLRPAAIWCFNRPDAEQVYLLASDLGLTIPEDVSIACLNSIWDEGVLARRLSCVEIDEFEVGRRARQLLEDMNCGDAEIDRRERIEVELSIRDGATVGPPFMAGNRSVGKDRTVS